MCPQELYITIVYNSGWKQSNAGFRSRGPADLASQKPDDDSALFGLVTESDIAAQNCAYPELGVVIDFLQVAIDRPA